MKDLGYGKGYQYAHDDQEAIVLQNHLPPPLEATTYYQPTTRGFEAIIRDRLTKWKQLLQQRARGHKHHAIDP
jgi:putative ATPase